MIDFMIWQKHNFKSLNKNDYRRNYESKRLKRLSQLLLTTHRWMMENDYSSDHEWDKIEITDMLGKLKRRLRIKSFQNILSNQKSIKSHKFTNDLTNIHVKSLWLKLKTGLKTEFMRSKCWLRIKKLKDFHFILPLILSHERWAITHCESIKMMEWEAFMMCCTSILNTERKSTKFLWKSMKLEHHVHFTHNSSQSNHQSLVLSKTS